MKSSFNGRIREIPGVFVDNFENPSRDGAKAYFLSHYHADHIQGLDRDELRWKLQNNTDIFIYATKMTAAIVIHNNIDLKDYVRVLDPGSNLIIIPGDAERKEPERIVNVTLIPAGHCLGSTMFIFETTSVKLLYTGDFRIRENDLSKYAGLHDNNGEVINLDALYIDTTFIDQHENFPKRSDSIEEAMSLMKRLLESNPDLVLVLEPSASYGYEYVYNQIYKSLGLKVYVDWKKWSFYRSILQSVPGVTNDESETRIFVNDVPRMWLPHAQIKRIKFSAQRWRDWSEDKTPIDTDGDCIFICFSTHCSRVELTSFVEYLKPRRIVGFPNPYRVRGTPSMLTRESVTLSPIKSPRKHPCTSNKSCKDKKVDNAVLKQLFG